MLCVGSLCMICLETSSTHKICGACSRGACEGCVKTFLTSRIHQGYFAASYLVCPNCGTPYSPEELQQILDPGTRERLDRLHLLSLVNRDPQRCWCPNRECGAPVDLELRKSFGSRRSAKCGTCETEFCRRCGELPHRGNCPREKSYTEWFNNEQLRGNSDGVRPCPTCHHHIEKRGGCQHMSCTMCNEEWCWICRRPWRGHKTATCRAVALYHSKGWGEGPLQRAATMTMVAPLVVCAGVGALAVGTAVGAGTVICLTGYFTVAWAGKKVEGGVRSAWDHAQAKLEARKASKVQHADVPEDVVPEDGPQLQPSAFFLNVREQ